MDEEKGIPTFNRPSMTPCPYIASRTTAETPLYMSSSHRAHCAQDSLVVMACVLPTDEIVSLPIWTVELVEYEGGLLGRNMLSAFDGE